MKKKPLILLSLALSLSLAYAWTTYTRHMERAKYYISLEHLETYAAEAHNNDNFLTTIKKSVERHGNKETGIKIIREAEDLRHEVSDILRTFKKVTELKLKLFYYHTYDIMAYEEGRQAIDLFLRYSEKIKQKYPYTLSKLGNITDQNYLHTESFAEAIFIMSDFTMRLLECQELILRNLFAKVENHQNLLNIVPFLQTSKQTHYEGDSFEGTLHLLNPMLPKKAQAALNGKPAKVDKNGIARVLMPVGETKQYIWEGAFLVWHKGRDTTIRFKETYDLK